MEDSLQHYGVMGMKWGNRKGSDIIRDKMSSNAYKRDRLESKKFRVDTKIAKFDKKYTKKIYKLTKKELKLERKGDTEQLREIQLKLKAIDVKANKLKMKSANIKNKVMKNEKVKRRLEEKLELALYEEAMELKKSMTQ